MAEPAADPVTELPALTFLRTAFWRVWRRVGLVRQTRSEGASAVSGWVTSGPVGGYHLVSLAEIDQLELAADVAGAAGAEVRPDAGSGGGGRRRA
jgi:hypothetical protein